MLEGWLTVACALQTPASSGQKSQQPGSEKTMIPPGRTITAPDGMDNAEDVDVSFDSMLFPKHAVAYYMSAFPFPSRQEIYIS